MKLRLALPTVSSYVAVHPVSLGKMNSKNMKGVSIICDETRKKRYVQIDVDVLATDREAVEDLLDVIIAEIRKEDEMVPWEKAKAELRKSGKL